VLVLPNDGEECGNFNENSEFLMMIRLELRLEVLSLDSSSHLICEGEKDVGFD
jgi:hypothetical protein